MRSSLLSLCLSTFFSSLLLSLSSHLSNCLYPTLLLWLSWRSIRSKLFIEKNLANFLFLPLSLEHTNIYTHTHTHTAVIVEYWLSSGELQSCVIKENNKGYPNNESFFTLIYLYLSVWTELCLTVSVEGRSYKWNLGVLRNTTQQLSQRFDLVQHAVTFKFLWMMPVCVVCSNPVRATKNTN